MPTAEIDAPFINLNRYAGPNGDIPRPDPVRIPPALDREMPIRVAVIAEGAVTPIGNSADVTWENFKAQQSGIVENPYFPYTELQEGETDPRIRARTAGTVKNFNPVEALAKTGVMPTKDVRFSTGPYSQYALASAFEALSKIKASNGEQFLVPRDVEGAVIGRNNMWKVNDKLINPLHVSTLVGTGFGGGAVSSEVLSLMDAGLTPSADHMMRSLADRAASIITQSFGLYGGGEANTAACASSGKAMLNAMFRIALGLSDVALAVGTEGLEEKFKLNEEQRFNPITAAEFDAFGALDRNPDPAKVARSLHDERHGFTLAEGAVTLALANPDWARRHGIPVLYEIVGFGDVSGGGHNTQPNGPAQEVAMRMARRRAEAWGKIEGKVINSGHYTATPLGEESEMLHTQNVLDDLQLLTSIIASKRYVGHMLGAAGNMAAFIAGRILNTGIVPGMTFDGDVMKEAHGWHIPRETFDSMHAYTDALINQFGFGDANVSLWARLPR